MCQWSWENVVQNNVVHLKAYRYMLSSHGIISISVLVTFIAHWYRLRSFNLEHYLNINRFWIILYFRRVFEIMVSARYLAYLTHSYYSYYRLIVEGVMTLKQKLSQRIRREKVFLGIPQTIRNLLLFLICVLMIYQKIF